MQHIFFFEKFSLFVTAARLLQWQCLFGLLVVGEAGFLAPFKMPQIHAVQAPIVGADGVTSQLLVEANNFFSDEGEAATPHGSKQALKNSTFSESLPHQKQGKKAQDETPKNANVIVADVKADVMKSTFASPQGVAPDSTSIQSRDASEQDPKKTSSRSNSKEGKLIKFMRKYAVDEHDVQCVIYCRYGEAERHSWTQCLHRCVRKDDLRRIFLKMLPAEHHDAKTLEYMVPNEFEAELKVMRARRQKTERHGEL